MRAHEAAGRIRAIILLSKAKVVKQNTERVGSTRVKARMAAANTIAGGGTAGARHGTEPRYLVQRERAA